MEGMFEKNQDTFKSCTGFHMNFDELPTTEGKTPQAESRVKSFLSQVESEFPIILEDAYDIAEITWMCDRLRTSDRFGTDNKLYLQYSSWSDFLKSMETLDWTYIANSGKAVFLFGEEQKLKYYPTTAQHAEPAPLQIDEIVEIINSIPRGFSGSDFFNMILDSHPSLLTIGWHGLSSFAILWKVFCKDKTVKEAVKHLRNPNSEEEIGLQGFNLSHMLKYKYESDGEAVINTGRNDLSQTLKRKYKERVSFFLEGLSLYLDSKKTYSIHDWFKAFYLSANMAVGRKFLQRITPAIFYDKHGISNKTKEKVGITDLIQRDNITPTEISAMNNEVYSGFKYKRRVGIVRSPLATLGSTINRVSKDIKFTIILNYMHKNTYGRRVRESNPEFPVSAHVRFEDLKLYPRETTEKLCEFLRIPWSETCLHITTNGEDSGIVDGTAGFDTKPVYNPHLEYMSTLDYYRIELLNAKNFQVWGYKLKYYDGTKYSPEDLEKLFAIPFKIETMELNPKKWLGWPNQDEIKEFHEWILKRVLDVMEHGEKDYSVDKNGKPLRLVEVLVPDLKPGQKLYE